MRAMVGVRNPRERLMGKSHLYTQILGIAASTAARAVSEIGWHGEKGLVSPSKT